MQFIHQIPNQQQFHHSNSTSNKENNNTNFINSCSLLALDLANFQQTTLADAQVQHRHERQLKKQQKAELISNQLNTRSQSHELSSTSIDSTSYMTPEERQLQQKMNKEELFGSTKQHQNSSSSSSSSKLESGQQYDVSTIEDQLESKTNLANEMEDLTTRLKSQVTNINKTLHEEQSVLSSIETNVELTSMTLENVNQRLGDIVSGAWWDLFTNFFMMIMVLIVFAGVMGIIFVIPKAKWL